MDPTDEKIDPLVAVELDTSFWNSDDDEDAEPREPEVLILPEKNGPVSIRVMF